MIYRKVVKCDVFIFQISCHNHNLKPIHADYIYHKNGKSKSCETDLPLLKNDITNLLGPNLLVLEFQTIRTGNMPL
jgi:hypothetical protein